MFVGFNTGLSGLITSKRGLYVTGHNIDNSPRNGYSRQLINQEATMALRLPGLGYLGTGTEITSVSRARNFFVDCKYWQENAPLGEWQVKDETLTEVERIMGEVSETSFRQFLDDFYDALNDMTRNPGDISFREPVLETGLSFTKHINETASRLEKLRVDTYEEMDMYVGRVNNIADQIGLLNRQIYVRELDGHTANDLRDTREILVDELSQLVNVNVSETEDGRYDISVSGSSLVNHYHVKHMELKSEEGDIRLVWSNGSRVNCSSGKLSGFMDLIAGDGRGNNYSGIPFYQNKLSEFSKGFAKKFNEQHRKGYDLYGQPGKDFFIMKEGNQANSAENISVNPEILKDLKKLAAASTNPMDANGNLNINIEDNNNILKLLEQRDDPKFFESDSGNGTPDEFMKSILSSMAVDARQTNRFLETQTLLQKNLAARRQSISGVNLNEEVANIVKYQKTYVASSKIINTMDMLLDLTVNRLGMVGR